jgi:transmembrane sensor
VRSSQGHQQDESRAMDERTQECHEIEWSLIANYVNGECSEAERRRVEQWMRGDPARKTRIESLLKIRNAQIDEDLQSKTKAAWSEVLRRIQGLPREEPSSKRVQIRALFPRTVRIAAAILLFVGLPYAIVKLKSLRTESSVQPTMCIISTGRGQQTSVRLSDGTAVALNSMSVLEFPEQFANGPREVLLVGEAYFAVTQLDGIPFSVRTGKAVVQVLGTEFNVSAWPSDESDEVVVARGTVSVQSASIGVRGSVVLLEGQQTKVLEGKAPSLPRIVGVQKYTAWVHGQLMFEDTPFRDVIRTLERKYEFQCTVGDSSLLMYRITASFKDESLGEILRLMSVSMGAQYERQGAIVTFYSAAKKRSR